MNDKERPAEPAAGDKEDPARGGFAEVAKRLNREDPDRQRPISRQLVHKWWINRHFNRFPEAVETIGSGNGGQGRARFDIETVVDWYIKYRETRHRTTTPQRRTEPPTAGTVNNGTDTMAA